MAKYFGMNPPFIGGQQNVLSRQEDEQLIKNDLLQLLLTVPGERVNRPNFGVRLRSFVFEQGTQPDIALLEREVSNAIRKYEPRVRIEFLQITQSEDDQHTLRVKLVVSMRDDPRRRLDIDRFINSPVRRR